MCWAIYWAGRFLSEKPIGKPDVGNVGASVDWKKIEQIYEKYNLPENVRHHIEAVTLGVARL